MNTILTVITTIQWRMLLYGILLALSFAPFRIPSFAILSLALFYSELLKLPSKSLKKACQIGLWYGIGLFGFGVSWVYVSIHQYGHLHAIISAALTLLFILYLSLFTAGVGLCVNYFSALFSSLYAIISFSTFWMLAEWARASIFSGFPWLLIAYGQLDSPIHTLFPWIGIYGVGFYTACIAGILACLLKHTQDKLFLTIAIITLLFIPAFIKNPTSTSTKPLSVAIIQANIAMRDKWDENLFWKVVKTYDASIQHLLGTDIIVLPESAIPVPSNYFWDTLQRWNREARNHNTALLLGMPKPSKQHNAYYNAMLSLGKSQGYYLKQHLVPFGEYIPRQFRTISHLLHIPDSHMTAGSHVQSLMTIHNYKIATLICYEIAYNELLRQQLPQAQWIVSISDNGWFGHSFAAYQQQQMAQVLSLEANRYQIMANNDGLSSLISSTGEIISELPRFKSQILRSSLIPITNTTPWMYYGDRPIQSILLLNFCFILILHIAQNHRKRYAYKFNCR